MSTLLTKLESFKPLIGHTPLKKLEVPFLNVYAKLEYTNFSGSIKDRAAYYIIAEALRKQQITEDSIVVESSSGNFAIALMSICKVLGIEFIPVVDPNINEDYERILRLCCNVVKVSELDKTGGYLLSRIKKVKEIVSENSHAFWTDQYSNVNNYLSYYYSLGIELGTSLPGLDYIFLGVSSGGTITGVSKRLKEDLPNVKVIAVDIEGSLIFSDLPGKRYISGIGASQSSELLKYATIDEVIHVSHANIIQGCHELLSEQAIFAGASSGASYYAVKQYFKDKDLGNKPPVVAFICPDKGNAYLDNIYNDTWVKRITNLLSEEAIV